jgi:uncharacterized protein (TIGR03437 family)
MRSLYAFAFLVPTFAVAAAAQIVLDPSPVRVIGHQPTTPAEQLTVTNINPNFSVSGGLYSPAGVAVDTTGSTPILYVADTGNNRILAWKNATSSTLANEQAPDLVIGQLNGSSTLPSINGGLHYPTGLLVDPSGNLYVADSGNNRILRYPKPFANIGGAPDIVLGQKAPYTPSGASAPYNLGNQGATTPSAKTICLYNQPGSPGCARGGGPFLSSLAMDGSGNLFVVDAGNSRVLRYSSGLLTSGAMDPAADLVVGQAGFTVVNSPTGVTDKSTLVTPAGAAFDSAGHLFVTDLYNRMLVFPATVSVAGAGNGLAAIRFAGIVNPPPATATASTLNGPNGIVMIGNNAPAVLDSADNRLLFFDAFSSPDWATTDPNLVNPPPVATAVLGQGTNLSNFAGVMVNAGNPQASFTTNNTAVATFNDPVAAAVNANGDLFVVDTGNNRVLVYATDGSTGISTEVLGQSGFPYNSPNSIHGKEFDFGSGSSGDAGIAVDSPVAPRTGTPHLYVSDPGNSRVLGFADARAVGPGKLADIVIGEIDMLTGICNFVPGVVTTPPTPTASTLCYPTGLAVDPATGDLYVADTYNGRVLRFPDPFDPANSSQQANLVLGQKGFTDIPNPQATQSGMVAPYGLFFDPVRGLLVSDESANRVLLFPITSSTSNYEEASTVMGQSDFFGTGTSALSAPHHIAEDSIAELYVADSGDGQIQIFNSPSGGGATDTPINSITGLYYPQAVWVNRNKVAGYQNDIWVGDSYRLIRYPVPNPLVTGITPSLTLPAAELPSGNCPPGSGFPYCAVIAITQDSLGNLYVADTSNRVAIHYAALSATNGASFVCAMACTLGGLLEQSYYLAPGAYGSLFTFNSLSLPVTATTNYVLPVPTELGGIEVLISCATSVTCPPPPPAGQTACAAPSGFACAPLAYVSPSQINFVVPFEAPTAGTAELEVINPSTSQVLGSGSLNMSAAAPGFFIETCAAPCSNPSGQTPAPGQIAALNCNTQVNGNCDDHVNGTANPANPGAAIQLFLTGQGAVLTPTVPADGEADCGQVKTQAMPEVVIGTTIVPSTDILYSGLAPCEVGLWQINVIIPSNPGQPATAGWPPNVFPVLVKYNGLVTDPPGYAANPSLAGTIMINAPQ